MEKKWIEEEKKGIKENKMQTELQYTDTIDRHKDPGWCI